MMEEVVYWWVMLCRLGGCGEMLGQVGIGVEAMIGGVRSAELGELFYDG